MGRANRFDMSAAAILVLGATGSGYCQSLSSLKVGDDLSATTSLNADPANTTNMGPFSVNKWTLPDGNSLSVTSKIKTQKIVFIECDWNGSDSGSFSDFPDFYFGRTSLNEIRRQLRSNGFTFKDIGGVRPADDGGIALLNSYSIEDYPTVIVTFVTKIGLDDMKALKDAKLGESRVGDAAKLNAIIIADPSYLGTIWGNNRTYDPRYVDINWK
jgi:hypothetical protein